MKRIDVFRPLLIKFGLVISLAMTLLLFNFTSHINLEIAIDDPGIHEQEVEIIRTVHKLPQKQVPPPETVQIVDIEPSDPVEFTDSVVVDNTPFEIVDTTKIRVPMPKAMVAPSKPAVNPVLSPVTDAPILFADKMPFFGDCRTGDPATQRVCSDKALLKYLADHIRYPTMARENRIEGLVVIEFVVSKEGKLSGLRVLRDIGAGCGTEALRVVSEMPEWSPGVHHGRPVPVIFRLPVRYRLQ